MTSINPINVNSQGITGTSGYGTKSKSGNNEETEAEVSTAASSEKSSISADDVLTYLAQSAVAVTPKSATAVDTSKYVDDASAARIAGFMSDFENVVATNLSAITSEFPEMSDSAKQTLALAQADKQSA